MITLLLGVHAHQPVGNFDEVIEDAHQRCYRPFLEILHDYPDFRFSAHFSGWLLDWLRERHPEDIERLAVMVRRGQVELFGSGDTEPVLAAIPERDRIGQMRRLSEKLARWTGTAPAGAWLTERVWESAVVPALAASGMRYAMVDDYHFLCTGLQLEQLDGYFSTEEDGQRIDLFPISESLRYRIPFSPARDLVGHLESLARQGRRAAVYFDDIEKFGIWPETHDWVYRDGWLRSMIEGVLASPLIRTARYADFHREQRTRGIVYLPSGSYREMNEWTLPMPAAGAYRDFLVAEKAAGRGERHSPFVRGGIWRNFLSRYPEANWMHKRMQQLSQRLAGIGTDQPGLTGHLYRAQANDAYWHGLFGGLYLPHLRRSVWSHLLALEARLDAISPRPDRIVADLDLDGCDEIIARSGTLQLALRDDGLAACHELGDHGLRHNFGDTLRRHSERYHQLPAAEDHAAASHGGIASAHDLQRVKHAIAAEDLVPDALPRACWIDSIDGQTITDYTLVDADDLVWRSGGVEKRYLITPGEVRVRWRLSGFAGRRFATTLNIALPSCDGWLGRWRLADGSIPGGFGDALRLDAATALTLEDGLLGASLRLACQPAAGFDCRPHRTVSQSEAGLEKIMQAVEIAPNWPVSDADCTIELQLVLAPTK